MIEHDPEKMAAGDSLAAKIKEELARRPEPTGAMKRKTAAILAASLSAAGVPTPPPPPVEAPKTDSPLPGFRRALVALAIAVGLASAGCVAPEAIEQARTEAAVAHGHALDGMLPIEARMIGADEERAWRAQHRALCGGDDVPGAETWAPLPPDLAAPAPGGGR